MKGKRSTKNALISSVLVFALCVSMLIGATFAWFTDTASTSVNKIQAGSLDVALEMKQGDSWVSAEGQTLSFIKADGTDTILWEPGCTYKLPALKVVNKGDLALKYKIVISGINGSAKLNEVIDWKMNGDPIATAEYTLNPGESSNGLVIQGHMQETAGNEYQGLSIDGVAITVYATQATAEFDSFNNTYDAVATYPVEIIPAVDANMTPAAPNAENKVESYSYSNSDNTLTATYVPTSPAAPDAPAPTVVVEPTSVTAGNVTIDAATQDAVAYDVSLKDSNGNVLSGTGTTTVKLFVGKNLSNVKVYHNNEIITGASYEASTGYVTFTTTSFSPFTIVFDSPVAMVAGSSYYSLQDALNVGGEVTLLKDVTIDSTKTAKTDRLTVTKPTTLNFNGHKLIAPGELEPTSNWAALYVAADTTINADENGGIQCLDKANGECGPYAMNIVSGANVTINGGTYYGGGTAVQVEKGSLTVNNGVFDGTAFSEPYVYKFILNCNDTNYRAGTAKITVNGGKFHYYDPMNAPCENPIANFVASGYGAIKNGDWYEVIEGTFVSSTEELTAALNAGNSTVYLKAGTYKVPGIANLTATLIGTSTETILDLTTETGQSTSGANLTFENMTVQGANSDYIGIQHCGNIVYNNVVFKDSTNFYGESVTCNNCTFNLTTRYIWTYGAKTVSFDNCTFNTDGKALLVYNEGSVNQTVNVKDCTFNATTTGYTGSGDACAAVEIDSRFSDYTINFSGVNTVDADFSGLYRIKNAGATNVVINQ